MVFFAILVWGLMFAAAYYMLSNTPQERERREKKKLEKQQQLLAEEKSQREKLYQNAQRDEIMRGEWVFPSKEFYLKCKDANFIELNNEYSIKKAETLAFDFIKKAVPDIDKNSCLAYLSVEQMKHFISIGEKQHRDAEEARIQKMKQPRYANPTTQEKAIIERASTLRTLKGIAKRKQIYLDSISDYARKISDAREGQQAMRTLGTAYLGQQKKDTSWAVMGGIAEGIAGPAAGVAVALDTMANNARNQAHNEIMAKTATDLYMRADDMSTTISNLEKSRSDLVKECSELSNKVVLSNPTAEEIWRSIQILDTDVKRNDSGVLEVNVYLWIKHPISVNAPENVPFVVDGTLTGIVFYEDTPIGTVHFPLPCYGLPINTNRDFTLKGLCNRSVEYPGTYTVKFEDTQNLWVMER